MLYLKNPVSLLRKNAEKQSSLLEKEGSAVYVAWCVVLMHTSPSQDIWEAINELRAVLRTHAAMRGHTTDYAIVLSYSIRFLRTACGSLED